MARRFNYAAIAVLAVFFSVNGYRAWSQSIAHDEAYTYQVYLSGTFANLFDYYDANHHFLYTMLAKLSVTLFGVSELSMRLPSLLAGALYFWSVYSLSVFLFGASAYCLLSVLVLSLNPLLLDFFVAARGYGLALALFFYALDECLGYLDASSQAPEPAPARGTLYRAGTAMALSVAANLVFLFPAVVLGFLFLGALALLDKRVPIGIGSPHKGKKKAEQLPARGKRLRAGLLGFALPAGAILLLFFITAPFDKAEKGIFYAGAAALMESFRSLVDLSFAHNPGLWALNRRPAIFSLWRGATLFVVLPATVLIAGWLWFSVCRNWWRNAVRYEPGRAELVLYLSFGTVAGAVVLLLTGHYLLDLPYPVDRTGIYFPPLFALASLGCLQMLRVRAGFRRAVAWGLAVALVISAVVFGIQFNTSRFAVWPYDADTKAIVQAIAARETNGTGPLRLGVTWQLEPSVNFYREILKLKRIQPVDRRGPRGDYDYYVLALGDVGLAETQHLKKLMEYPASGALLAMR